MESGEYSIVSNGLPDTATLPIARRKLADEVLDRLLRMIESGSVKPGEQIPSERELMTAFGVGRPAVREALQSLQGMGVISISHGERARVVSITPDSMFEQISRSARHLLSTSPQTLEHLKEARLMFELAMVRLAVHHASDEGLAKLRSVLERLIASRRDGRAFLLADMLFHETIASLSGNPLFTAVSTAMLSWLADFHVELVRQAGAEDITVTEHTKILKRIEARDEAGAVKAMSDHLTRASALYRSRKRPAQRNVKN